jgi:drug/metabolite transporter (DMT)-like permease
MRTLLRRMLLLGLPAALVVGGAVYGFGWVLAGMAAEADRAQLEPNVRWMALICAAAALLVMAAWEAVRLRVWRRGKGE